MMASITQASLFVVLFIEMLSCGSALRTKDLLVLDRRTSYLGDTTTCVVQANVSLASESIIEYTDMGSPDACCALCGAAKDKGCVAWTITNKTCALKSSAEHQTRNEAAVSGYFSTHYNNPYMGECLSDEVVKSFSSSLASSFCSPKCTEEPSGKLTCPSDKPPNVSAEVDCLLKDPIGTGAHCALVCSGDADCGVGAFCDKTYSAGVCSYTNPEGDLQKQLTFLTNQNAQMKQEESTLNQQLKEQADTLATLTTKLSALEANLSRTTVAEGKNTAALATVQADLKLTATKTELDNAVTEINAVKADAVMKSAVHLVSDSKVGHGYAQVTCPAGQTALSCGGTADGNGAAITEILLKGTSECFLKGKGGPGQVYSALALCAA